MTKEQWKAICEHDPAYDDQFCYALKTTKTICRPSCTARTFEPRNVVIFQSVDEALKEGYHPCRRCRPDLPEWHGAKQEVADRAMVYIREHFAEKFSLEAIANALFIDRIYLSKCFKEATGSTPLKYHNQIRCAEACKLLTDSDLNMEIIGSRVGFATPSHFARVFKSIYHCSPSEYRKHYFDFLKQE